MAARKSGLTLAALNAQIVALQAQADAMRRNDRAVHVAADTAKIDKRVTPHILRSLIVYSPFRNANSLSLGLQRPGLPRRQQGPGMLMRKRRAAAGFFTPPRGACRAAAGLGALSMPGWSCRTAQHCWAVAATLR